MSRQDRSSGISKIDRKWVKESKRTFSIFPGLPRTGVPGEEECWLELMQFYRDDLKWLLSLDHHKFWSHMIYSERAHELLISYLKGCPPCYIKNNILVREDVKNIFAEVEHLVFLVFLRLSTEKESESCYIRNFGEIIYNYYLFTVPIILDLCLIYGTSNKDLVKKMINNVVTSAPDFLDDFQEVIPHFVKALNTVKEKFSLKIESESEDATNETQDLVLYLCDSVATIQVFFELYPNVCQLFNKGEIVTEIVFFYSNVLPEMLDYCTKKYEPLNKDSLVLNLIENTRIDLLRIVKSIFDFILNETNDILEKKEEKINEYLVLMMDLLSEPTFLYDYNQMYSVEFEVGCAVKNCDSVDSVKVNSILKGLAKAVSSIEGSEEENFDFRESSDVCVKLNSLVTEVKDILPHLEESFIKKCLNYYNNDTEKVIAAVLENLIPPDLNENIKEESKSEDIKEYKGKHKLKHKNLNEMLNDREELNKIKDRYAFLSSVTDDTYDDEYDDTYDDQLDVPIREGDEIVRRPFVVPRVLRTREETEEEEEDERAEEAEEEEKDATEEKFGRLNFVENPSVIRERMERKRLERNARDVVGRGKGHGQSKEVLKNREFKESHKSFLANHNRKRQAGKKLSRGMIPS